MMGVTFCLRDFLLEESATWAHYLQKVYDFCNHKTTECGVDTQRLLSEYCRRNAQGGTNVPTSHRVPRMSVRRRHKAVT